MAHWYPEAPIIPVGWQSHVPPKTLKWESVVAPNDHWTLTDLKSLEITPENAGDILLQATTLRTRWLVDVYKQCQRAKSRGRTAILLLTFCPVGNRSTMDLDNPYCRTEKVLSAFEFVDGPLVINFNMRPDCRREKFTDKNSRYEESCLGMTGHEWSRCLELLVHEIKFATDIAGVKFTSVISMSAS
jgi:hypothetical protein